MASSMFFIGIGMVIICCISLPPSVLLYCRTKRELHLYICLLLANYLIELIELVYIARFCLPEDLTHFNLIHFPVLRTFTTVAMLLLDLLILLQIMGLKFRKIYLLLFVVLALFCAWTAWLPQTLLTVWLFYLPRQIYHFGYCGVFLIRRIIEKDEKIRKRMDHYCFLILGVFLLSISILLEDSLLIFHIQMYFTDMLSVTERNFSENMLWLFIMLYAMFYCTRELEHCAPVSTAMDMDTTAREESDDLNTDSEAIRTDGLLALAEEYKFTPREIQILDCILQYRTTAEICEKLHISTGTVKTHTHNIYMKVNVKNRQELIRVLKEQG